MSKRTSILEKNYTAYPNELIRNPNNFMTKNERHLLIFLWDRLYGFEYPNNELSYSVILRNSKDIPKNNAKLSDAVKGLERKGLLKVFRTNRNTNKYFIGEEQIKTIQWYGKNFKGWKEGIIEPPIEATYIQPIQTETPNEKIYLEQLTETEFKESYPDMNSVCHSMYGFQTIENFNKTADSVRIRREKKQQEKQKPTEPTEEEIKEFFKNNTF